MGKHKAYPATEVGYLYMKPVVFLDFDGVLNNPSIWGKRPLQTEALDENMVLLLNELVESMDLEIVISSSWRYGFQLDDLRSILKQKGLHDGARVISRTSSDPEGIRGNEVSAWLQDHGPRPFIIMDDMGIDQFEGLGEHLIQTDGAKGLTVMDCERAKRCIKRQLQEQNNV
jgi:hypothetical protein